MKLYSSDEVYKLYKGNMLDMLEVIEHNSIDAIVTDPPYELGFMSKSWDNSGIAFQKETWEKCLKVLKPGGHLLAFGGSRTHHRIAVAIEDAGFEIRDQIMWLVGSGFPKSMNIGLAIDKRNGKDFDTRSLLVDHIKECLKINNKTKEDLLKRFDNSAKVNHWLSNSQSNFYQPSVEEYEILVNEFGCSWDFYVEAADREVVGVKKNCLNNWGGKNNLVDRDITLPSTDEAKRWDGWGTQLKPSYEAIIVARKPVEGSIVDNVLKWGVGGINIDACRVQHNEDVKTTNRNFRDGSVYNDTTSGKSSFCNEENHIASADPKGRFPANTILTYDDTDYEEVCGGFPQTVSSGGSGEKSIIGNFKNVYGEYKGGISPAHLGGLGDSGSAARYFYCAKASKRDRDEGLDAFEAKKTSMMATNDNINADGEFTGMLAGRNTMYRNTHPTVKPTMLMQYLIRLVTPEHGIVLDPFNGSGSTGKAVVWENRDRNADYKYIGIELTEEYLPIAKARIEYAKNVEYIALEEQKAEFKKEKAGQSLSMFDADDIF